MNIFPTMLTDEYTRKKHSIFFTFNDLTGNIRSKINFSKISSKKAKILGYNISSNNKAKRNFEIKLKGPYKYPSDPKKYRSRFVKMMSKNHFVWKFYLLQLLKTLKDRLRFQSFDFWYFLEISVLLGQILWYVFIWLIRY